MSVPGVSLPSPRRSRRSGSALEAIRSAISGLLAADLELIQRTTLVERQERETLDQFLGVREVAS
jgi:hypothetical protein